MLANYGFNATLTAKPGMGSRLVDLLLTGLNEGSPGAAQAIVAQIAGLLAKESEYTDYVPVLGKTAF
jgi:hypothetical protein